MSTAGTYAGIGIEVSTADRALRVVRPFRDSPAAAAGIQSGDMISAIDGMPVGADLDAAMARMRGPRGSTVKLAVMRAGQALPLEFTVERAQVDVHSVAMAVARRRLRLRAHHRVQRYHRRGFRRRASRACAAI